MDFKDYYATLGVARSASQDEIKRAYRKLARKFHPDVSKEPDAEARFKEVAEAHEALIDPERRAAYDTIGQGQAPGRPFEPPPGWDSGFEFSGRGSPGAPGDEAAFSDFFESLFGHSARRRSAQQGSSDMGLRQGTDHHAKIQIDLLDAYQGAQRTIDLRVPVLDAQGRTVLHDRQLALSIPQGVREGQHLRLAGQGAPGTGGAPPGDLYLEIQFRPHPIYRVEGRDVHFELPISPWEAALGGTVNAPTPLGLVQLSIAAGSVAGRKLRLKGRGLPGAPPGDLYAVLAIVLPQAVDDRSREAWQALAREFADFNPRVALET